MKLMGGQTLRSISSQAGLQPLNDLNYRNSVESDAICSSVLDCRCEVNYNIWFIFIVFRLGSH